MSKVLLKASITSIVYFLGELLVLISTVASMVTGFLPRTYYGSSNNI